MEKNYFTIEEASKISNLPAYTIRYWENKTGLIRPLRLSSGHRRYTKEDIETIAKLKDLVFIKGYSVRGLKKAFSNLKKEGGFLPLKNEKKEAKKNISFLKDLNKDLKELLKNI